MERYGPVDRAVAVNSGNLVSNPSLGILLKTKQASLRVRH